MGTVHLKEQGKIYEDEFNKPSLDSRWEFIPNDPSRYTLEGEFLRLYHGSSPLYMFFKPLTEIKRFVMDVKNTYNPEVEGDVGGLVVMADSDNIIHIEEYLDTSTATPVMRTYPWIRLVRDYNTYSAYWSEDGMTWNFLGIRSLGLETPKIGIFLEGVSGQALDVEYVRISTGTDIEVNNMAEGTKVDLVDEMGILLESKTVEYSDTSVNFDIQHMGYPFRGNFNVTLPDGNSFKPQVGEVFNIHLGDKFNFELLVDLYYVEVDNSKATPVENLMPLIPNIERFLGYLQAGESDFQDVKMVAMNPFVSGEFQNVEFKLVPSQKVEDLDKVNIAPDVGGYPGTFSKRIVAYNILPGEPYEFWVRMNRELSFDRYASQITFGITVSSTYV